MSECDSEPSIMRRSWHIIRGVSECDSEASIMRMSWHTSGGGSMKKISPSLLFLNVFFNVFISDILYLFVPLG